MRKFYDVKKFILDSEEELKLNPEAKIKTLKEENQFITDSLQLISSRLSTIKEIECSKTVDDKILSLFNQREMYTLKKQALDSFCNNLFKKDSGDFFKYYSIIKVTKIQDNGLPIEYLKQNQVAYLYLSINPLAVLKTTKSIQILDATDGKTYGIVNHYQEILNEYFMLEIDQMPVKIKFPMTFGILILE